MELKQNMKISCLYAGLASKCLLVCILSVLTGSNTIQGAFVKPVTLSAKETLTVVKGASPFRATVLKSRFPREPAWKRKGDSADPWNQSLFLGTTDFSTSTYEENAPQSSKIAKFQSCDSKRIMSSIQSLRETGRSLTGFSFTYFIRLSVRAAIGQPISSLLRWFVSLFPFWVRSNYFPGKVFYVSMSCRFVFLPFFFCSTLSQFT